MHKRHADSEYLAGSGGFQPPSAWEILGKFASTRLHRFGGWKPPLQRSRSGTFHGIVAIVVCLTINLFASEALLKEHCADCHNDKKAKGKFKLKHLGGHPTDENLERWLDCLDLVIAEEMPQEDDSHLSSPNREKLAEWFDEKIRGFESKSKSPGKTPPRRLNNREFANSVRDVLLLDHVGTHQPTDNLIGDTLHHGFDTHGESLGFSRFHLEQYIESVRKIVNGAILSGKKPEPQTHQTPAEGIIQKQRNQNVTRTLRRGKDGQYDMRDPNFYSYFEDLPTVTKTGNYQIKIKCTAVDRTIFDTEHTGFYHGDPIRLSVHLGDKAHTFDLPDNEVMEIDITEWMAGGSQLKLFYQTDAYAMRGNGNFKFQMAITPLHLKDHDPERYAKMVEEIKQNPKSRKRQNVDSWHNWTEQWMGGRPRIFSAEVERPFFESWPPKRQVALIGENPSVDNAEAILRPIAIRAWRRPLRDGELNKIVAMVEAKAKSLNDIEALKEGIVAVLISPAFLLLNSEGSPANRFANKFSYFLQSTAPDQGLRDKIEAGKLDTFKAVKAEVETKVMDQKTKEFMREFPFAWLELNDINFMSPDPQHYRFYHKKRVSEDMVDEVLHFFRHVVDHNLPVPEFLSADYSFINADLAAIYGITNVEPDSILRKYTFKDGRRGGLLGMGAFLTVTADSLSTSPIHRAIYVMENLMGIHPTPPPPDVEIKEPDVRQAKTIKEILAAHNEDETCASCHRAIDPWGYAFENFDPTGAWRDVYTVPAVLDIDENGVPKKKRKKDTTIPIDSSAEFRSGLKYADIREFRKQVLTDANRDRFMRCFISKLLTYANGVEPTKTDFVEITNILSRSAEHDYRIVETIAAVIDSPLFRNF